MFQREQERFALIKIAYADRVCSEGTTRTYVADSRILKAVMQAVNADLVYYTLWEQYNWRAIKDRFPEFHPKLSCSGDEHVPMQCQVRT